LQYINKFDLQAGIYKILRNVKGVEKVYIGSSVEIFKRYKSHLNSLRNDDHYNRHLQASFNKYGEDKFIFEVIENVEDVNIIIKREQHWLDYYESYNHLKGYNISPTAGNVLGIKWTEESKEKVREGRKGKKSGSNNNFYGKTQSQETRNRISNHRKGKPLSDEIKRKMSLKNRGENHNLAKLNNSDVLKIVERIKLGEKISEIAMSYNINLTTIYRINNGRAWSHITGIEYKKSKIREMR
jgi:group I intron endonuclease